MARKKKEPLNLQDWFNSRRANSYCQTCRQSPEVREAITEYLTLVRESRKSGEYFPRLARFYNEILVRQLGYRLTIDALARHIKGCLKESIRAKHERNRGE